MARLGSRGPSRKRPTSPRQRLGACGHSERRRSRARGRASRRRDRAAPASSWRRPMRDRQCGPALPRRALALRTRSKAHRGIPSGSPESSARPARDVAAGVRKRGGHLVGSRAPGAATGSGITTAHAARRRASAIGRSGRREKGVSGSDRARSCGSGRGACDLWAVASEPGSRTGNRAHRDRRARGDANLDWDRAQAAPSPARSTGSTP
jgi:hypothetical protein